MLHVVNLLLNVKIVLTITSSPNWFFKSFVSSQKLKGGVTVNPHDQQRFSLF